MAWMAGCRATRRNGCTRPQRATRRGDQIVEIGSFRGRSTIVLAGAAPDGVAIVAIDPHAGNDRGPQEISGFEVEAASDHEVFTANLAAAGLADRVHHVREFSDRAHADVSGPIAVLYIDGAHRYAPALSDIRSWGARVEPGGTMLIHDSFSSVGVTLAIVRELMCGRRFRYVGRSCSLSEYRADLGGVWQSRRVQRGRPDCTGSVVHQEPHPQGAAEVATRRHDQACDRSPSGVALLGQPTRFLM